MFGSGDYKQVGGLLLLVSRPRGAVGIAALLCLLKVRYMQSWILV